LKSNPAGATYRVFFYVPTNMLWIYVILINNARALKNELRWIEPGLSILMYHILGFLNRPISYGSLWDNRKDRSILVQVFTMLWFFEAFTI